MKIIYTNKGEPFIVDDEDYPWLSTLKWRKDKNGYAVTTAPAHRPVGVPHTLRMHRMVMGVGPGDPRVVDHRFHVTNDNRKSQLRICTVQENAFNSNITPRNKSGFKGVTYNKWGGLPWRAAIAINKKMRFLGVFETPELAHEFYCLAADLVYGEFANHGSPHSRRIDGRQTAAQYEELETIAPLVKAALGE